MATWETIRTIIRDMADVIDDPGAYSLRSPGTDIEIQRNVLITPGGAWGSTKTMEIYLMGISQYLDDQNISDVAAIKSKLNELISSYAQLKDDYDNSTVPTTAADVSPLP